MAVPQTCLDEYGATWIVRKGDVGYSHMMKLGKAGFKLVVLPQDVILGVKQPGEIENISTNKLDTTHLIRLSECMEVLR